MEHSNTLYWVEVKENDEKIGVYCANQAYEVMCGHQKMFNHD